MITPQNGTPGVIGHQHGLTQLVDTLAAVRLGQVAQQQRDGQLQALLTALEGTAWWCVWAVVGLGVVVLLLSGVIGWQLSHPPKRAYVRALGALDATLVQTWSTLPKAAQEQLSGTYSRLGLTPPGDRAKR
jgi:hypothetical protein